MSRSVIGLNVIAIAMLAVFQVYADDVTASNAPPEGVLLIDDLGRAVHVPTNAVPPNLQPPAEVGFTNQIPNPVSGSRQPVEVQQRLQKEREGQKAFQFFPSVPPPLMPYLASQDDYGNTAVRPGAMFHYAPFDPWVQEAKYALSDFGLRYSLQQTLTYVSMTDVKQGDNTLAFYTFDLKSKWAIFNAPSAGTAGWLSSQ